MLTHTAEGQLMHIHGMMKFENRHCSATILVTDDNMPAEKPGNKGAEVYITRNGTK